MSVNLLEVNSRYAAAEAKFIEELRAILIAAAHECDGHQIVTTLEDGLDVFISAATRAITVAGGEPGLPHLLEIVNRVGHGADVAETAIVRLEDEAATAVHEAEHAVEGALGFLHVVEPAPASDHA